MYCPQKEKMQQTTTFVNHQDLLSIYDFQTIVVDTQQQQYTNGIGDEWETNNV